MELGRESLYIYIGMYVCMCVCVCVCVKISRGIKDRKGCIREKQAECKNGEEAKYQGGEKEEKDYMSCLPLQ